MKKIFTLLLILPYIIGFSQTNLFEDFESYSGGDFISQTSSTWRTWSGSGDGSNEDCSVIDTFAFAGDKSLLTNLTFEQDILWDLGGQYSDGTAEFKMQMYVFEGNVAYYNMQAVNPIVAGAWSYEVFFETNEMAYIQIGANNIVDSFSYEANTWFETGVKVDFENNDWQITKDGDVMATVQTTVADNTNSMGYINIFSNNGFDDMQTTLFAIDNLSFEHTPPTIYAPVAAFTSAQGNDIDYTFTNTSGGSEGTYLWDFGDGGTSTDENPSYTYTTEGTYNVCLTVTNATATDTYCEDVFVYALPTVIFNPTITDNVVVFDGVVFGTATDYFWDFGDGATANTEDATHTYAVTGIYNVCYTVSNLSGSVEVCEDVIIQTLSNLENFDALNISVAPNPTTNYLNFTGNTQLIKNITLVFENGQSHAVAIENNRIDMSFLAKGNYILLIEDIDGKHFVEKISKH